MASQSDGCLSIMVVVPISVVTLTPGMLLGSVTVFVIGVFAFLVLMSATIALLGRA